MELNEITFAVYECLFNSLWSPILRILSLQIPLQVSLDLICLSL